MWVDGGNFPYLFVVGLLWSQMFGLSILPGRKNSTTRVRDFISNFIKISNGKWLLVDEGNVVYLIGLSVEIFI